VLSSFITHNSIFVYLGPTNDLFGPNIGGLAGPIGGLAGPIGVSLLLLLVVVSLLALPKL
jgi:hypothetical protein